MNIPENHRMKLAQYWILEKIYHPDGMTHEDRILERSLVLKYALNQYDYLESNREREDIRYEVVKVSPIE